MQLSSLEVVHSVTGIVVLIADGQADPQGDSFLPSMIDVPKMVSVSINFRLDLPPIGFARPYFHGMKLLADFFFYESGRALSGRSVAPAMRAVQNANGRINIEEIAFGPSNVDPRIPAVRFEFPGRG